MISAGRLRFSATIKRENTTDNLGKKNKSFSTTVGTFRCDLQDLGSTEVSYGEGVANLNSYEVHARWQAVSQYSLTTADRLLIDGKTFQISGIRNEYNRDRLATITVEEIL
jgi:hypothetical protein